MRNSPISITRVRLAIAATLPLVGCSSYPYEYVELASDNLEVTEVGRPPVIGSRRDIPIRYTLKDPNVSLSLTRRGETFKIESSVPIAAVSIEPGLVVRESPFDYTVSCTWRLIDNATSPVGKLVRISIDLEGRADPISITGVVAESGRIYYGVGI